MPSRLELHNELLRYLPDVYFQPPKNMDLSYPCIIYNKNDKQRKFGNDEIYLSTQEYNITLIEYDPDSPIADSIESYFTHCAILQYYVVDNLNHTTLKLYY